ncbi:hypothetical protein DV736_g6101, partial [Chaetothyriales sp. CBS 134916]
MPSLIRGESLVEPSPDSTTLDHERKDIASLSSPEQEQPSLLEQVSSRPGDTTHADLLNYHQPDTNDDHWIALGSIRLLADGMEQQPVWMMQGIHSTQPWPHPTLDRARERRWIRSQLLQHVRHRHRAVLRIHIFPEDIGRAARGSLKEFRKVIKWLIPFIDTSSSTWNGDFQVGVPIQNYAVPRADKEESLFYIFNTLESPKPDLDTFKGSSYAQRAMEDIINDNILGMRSTLYPYQTRSVAAMLQREEDPAFSQDPRKPLYRDLKSKTFYLDIFDGAVAESPELYEEPRGGILAETMGYGKTLTCLALILATRGHYPSVPELRVERQRPQFNPETPSLLTLAARKLRQAGLPWKAEFDALRLQGEFYDTCVEELQKYHREFLEPIFNPTTPTRQVSKREAERVLRLCSATLVIVPPNLLVQWQHEIAKHIEPGVLDLLVLDSSIKTTPDWRQLMEYDIVLISKARFEQEYRDDDLNQARRLPGEDKYKSPFTELRWLRVICDEGHAFAGSASRTNSLMMLNKMSVERLWSISGTPSHALHGVEVSLPSIDENNAKSRSGAVSRALEQRRMPVSAEQECKDVERLRLIVTHFFKIQPWGNMKSQAGLNWKKYLAPFDADGNRRCAPGLRTLLQSLMVRHRLSDINIDLQLPPLYNRTVYIKPSYYDKLTLNLFMMSLISNAVTSERVDEDYMHHPRNRQQLDELISNLRQATFHWVGISTDDVMGTMRVSNGYLDNNIDNISDSDGVLLTQAIQAGQRALGDPGWVALSTLHEIGMYIENFPSHAAEAWSLTGEATEPLLLGTVQARDVRKYVTKNKDSEYVTEGMVGAGLRAMIEARERAQNDMAKSQRSSNPSSGTSSIPAGVIISEEPKLKTHTSRPPLNISSNSKKRRAHIESYPSSTYTNAAATYQQLAQTRILGFTSAKLTYLCSQLLSHPADTKSIVFYTHNNAAFFLAEALELLSIDFRIYANTLSPSTRSQYLHAFNTDTTTKVLLMDFKQAAHGLHVAAASRVYFVGPVWDVSAEAQAIKRAHRIGQTKPVYVETLVLEDTIEDRMWRRRKRLSDGGGGDLSVMKGWLDDEGVVGIIKNERFLAVAEGEEQWNVPRLVSDESQRLFRREMPWGEGKNGASDGGDGGEEETEQARGDISQEVRPRKRVMFAE